jgi:3-hydroxyisobutyrate dehydrogenase
MAHIAFLGTGLLGAAFVEAALGRGDAVTVWNRTASKAEALSRFGATVARTPADAVRGAQRVHLVLTDDPIVDEVIAALRPGLGANTVICDHSTTNPAQTAERSRRLNADGARYLHCPVFIGPPAARAGLGTILAAGPRANYAAVEQGLARMAAKVEYLGERADLAAVYKLCGNAFIIGVAALVADVLSVAKAAGVGADEALRVVEMFDPGAAITGRGRAMADGDWSPNFELVMARKDVRLMIETAGKLPLATLPQIALRMDALIAAGRAHDDMAVLGVNARG